MKKQITSVSLGQNAKMAAALYVVISLPIMLVFAAILAISGQAGQALVVLVATPVVYAGVAALGTLIGGWLYNVVAARVGGFEFTTAEVKAG